MPEVNDLAARAERMEKELVAAVQADPCVSDHRNRARRAADIIRELREENERLRVQLRASLKLRVEDAASYADEILQLRPQRDALQAATVTLMGERDALERERDALREKLEKR